MACLPSLTVVTGFPRGLVVVVDAVWSEPVSGEHRPEPIPPGAYCLVADVDAALMEQILDPSQRKRKTDIHHHCQADNLG